MQNSHSIAVLSAWRRPTTADRLRNAAALSTMKRRPSGGDRLGGQAMRGRKGEPAAPPARGPAPQRREPPRLGLLPELLGYQLRRAQIAALQNFNRAVGPADGPPGR